MDHLAFVRAQGCVVRGKAADHCLGPTEAHHVRTAANSGMGMKPSDHCAVGLCVRHHRALHAHGRRTFEARHGVDLAAEATRLALEHPTPPPLPTPPTKEAAPMSDVAPPDATLAVLRDREQALVIAGQILAGKLEVIRELITECSPRTRPVRRPRQSPDAGPQHVAGGLEDALNSLGAAVRDRELVGAG